MKRVQIRGNSVFLNTTELGVIGKRGFTPTAAGERFGLCWAQVTKRSAMTYVSDVLLRLGKLTSAESHRSRVEFGRGRKV